jgi:nitric oxide dioxygenase
MNKHQIELVKNSWAQVAALDAEVVGGLFYNRLFEIAPQIKPMFRSPLPEQSRKLLSMLAYVINKLDKLEDILDEVSKLAQRHVQYGVKEEHYGIVAAALLWTLEQGLGDGWTEPVQEAWILCYTTLSGAMIQAAGKLSHAA